MNPDKGFREWFAKIVITYTKQKTDAIVQDQIERRIRYETDVVHNWTRRWTIANLFRIVWACVRALYSGILFGFLVAGTVIGVSIWAIGYSRFNVLLCQPNSDTCVVRGVLLNDTVLVTAETVNRFTPVIESQLDGLRFIFGEALLYKLCK